MLDIGSAIAMAVTEAGCDLTYCKMRGIVAVLTGELQRHEQNARRQITTCFDRRKLNFRQFPVVYLKGFFSFNIEQCHWKLLRMTVSAHFLRLTFFTL